MAIVGQRRKRYRKANFLVEVDDVQRAEFVTCSAIKPTIEIAEFREGTDIEPEKLPALLNTDNITLSYGTSTDLDFWDWFIDAADSVSQGGLTDDLVIRSMEVVQRDRNQTDAIRYPVAEATPVSIEVADWDKNAAEIHMTTVEVAVRGVGRPILAGAF